MAIEVIIAALITAAASLLAKFWEKPESRDDLNNFIVFLKKADRSIKEERVMLRPAPTRHLNQLADKFKSLSESSGSDPGQLGIVSNNIRALEDEITSISVRSKISSLRQGPSPKQTIFMQPAHSSTATMLSQVSKKPESRDDRKERVMRRPASTGHLEQLANEFESLAASSGSDPMLLRFVAKNIRDHKDAITSISDGSKISSPSQGPRHEQARSEQTVQPGQSIFEQPGQSSHSRQSISEQLRQSSHRKQTISGQTKQSYKQFADAQGAQSQVSLTKQFTDALGAQSRVSLTKQFANAQGAQQFADTQGAQSRVSLTKQLADEQGAQSRVSLTKQFADAQGAQSRVSLTKQFADALGAQSRVSLTKQFADAQGA